MTGQRQPTNNRTRTTNGNGRRPQTRPDAAQRTVPHDTAAEEALLGRMLLDPTTIEAAQPILNSGDFYRAIHGHIYDAITILHNAGEGVDPASVTGWLTNNLGLDPKDGHGLGATSLLGGIATLPNTTTKAAVTHARTVNALARRRRLIGLAQELQDHAYTGTDPATTLEELTEQAATASIDRLRQQMLVGDAIMNLPPGEPLIDGILDLDSLAALYGRAGSFKSFVAIDWALSVSTGSWWFGHQVVKGRVLYVVAEGAVGVPQRVDAWKNARRTWSIGDIIWLPVPVDIFHTEEADDAARFAQELAPSLIVIDTLARSVPAADENSARDMGLVVANADRLRRATGACVLVVHHTGRDEARGMRGSTVLEGAMDTTLECRKNEDGAVEITSTKQKNRESGQKLRFAMAKEHDSLVLAEWRGEQMEDGLPPTAEGILTILHEIDTGDGVTSTLWYEASSQTKPSFYRWRKRLLELGLVTSEGAKNQKRYSITQDGLVAIGVVELERQEQF